MLSQRLHPKSMKIGWMMVTRFHINSGSDYFIGHEGVLFIIPRWGKSLYRIPPPNDPNSMALELFETDTAPQEVITKVCDRFDNIKSEEIGEFISNMVQAGILVEEDLVSFAPDLEDRYSRQLLYFEQNMFGSDTPHRLQSLLSTKRVAIVGVGGAGAPIAQMLAGSGIGSLTLIDPDCVDMTNLGRQIAYSTLDVGLHKTAALKSLIEKTNPQVDVKSVEAYLDRDNSLSLLSGADVAVLAADEPVGKIEYWMDDACEKLELPYLSVSNSAPIIRIGPLYTPGIAGGYRRYRDLLADEWEESGSFSGVLDGKPDTIANNVWSCYALGSLAVGQLIQWLCTGRATVEGRALRMNVDAMDVSDGISLS